MQDWPIIAQYFWATNSHIFWEAVMSRTSRIMTRIITIIWKRCSTRTLSRTPILMPSMTSILRVKKVFKRTVTDLRPSSCRYNRHRRYKFLAKMRASTTQRRCLTFSDMRRRSKMTRRPKRCWVDRWKEGTWRNHSQCIVRRITRDWPWLRLCLASNHDRNVRIARKGFCQEVKLWSTPRPLTG